VTSSIDRYHRQSLLAGIGADGQRRLADSTALILGCGALGCVSAELLARAGVGRLRIVDRDFVELTNLQRQLLYDERDAAEALPKAIAAKRRLERINSEITIEAHVDDVNYTNIDELAGDADVLIDGLDNLETRYLANDYAVSRGRPYAYGAAVGTSGMGFTILPHGSGDLPWENDGGDNHATPCFRCLFEEMPPAGTSPTCDTIGVLSSLVTIVASFQVTEALKVLTGNFAKLRRTLLNIELWDNDIHQLGVDGAYENGDCPCCKHRHFEYLEGESGNSASVLCGRNAVQLRPRKPDQAGHFEQLAVRLRTFGEVTVNEFMLRALVADGAKRYEISLFRDGRAIIKGTDQADDARSIYARYVGS